MNFSPNLDLVSVSVTPGETSAGSTATMSSTSRCLVRLIGGLLATCAPLALAAQHAYTSPRGWYTVKVPGGTVAGTPARTYLGIQLLPDARYGGLVSGVSGKTLTLSNAGNPSQLADPERKCYLHVLDGNGQGFVTDIDEFRTSDIVCADELGPWIQPNTRVLIRPHSNLSNLFGTNNRFGLGADTDAGAADNVVIWDPATQLEKVYYFHSTRARWEEKDIEADAGTASIRFPHGLYLVRRTSGTLRIALSGEIGSDSVLLPVHSGAHVFSLPVNLAGSLDQIVRTVGDFPVLSGPNANRADILTFEEPTTGLQRGPFYHLARPNDSGWRQVGVDGSTAPIQPLDFLSTLIYRRNGNAGHVFAQGSLNPPAVPRPPLPPDPEPGELPLTAEFPLRQQFPSSVIYTVEVSTDLQTWSTHAITSMTPDRRLIFDLPSGQRRAFYRLKISMDF